MPLISIACISHEGLLRENKDLKKNNLELLSSNEQPKGNISYLITKTVFQNRGFNDSSTKETFQFRKHSEAARFIENLLCNANKSITLDSWDILDGVFLSDWQDEDFTWVWKLEKK